MPDEQNTIYIKLKGVFVAFLWEWAPQHSFAICSQKKLMLISASCNTLVESLYIKFQPTNSRLNSTQKNVFLEPEVVPLNFFTASEARVSAQFLLPASEQLSGGITDHITHELSLPTFARSTLR